LTTVTAVKVTVVVVAKNHSPFILARLLDRFNIRSSATGDLIETVKTVASSSW
jgi:hypothetical protein